MAKMVVVGPSRASHCSAGRNRNLVQLRQDQGKMSVQVLRDLCSKSAPLMELALRSYVRTIPLAWGKYRLVNSLWRSAAGANWQREAKLIYSDFRVPCDISELIQRQLYFFGTYQLERSFLKVWQALARCSDVIFDVGANAGIYSLAAISANSRAMVHAFEPTREIAERLRQTKDMNGLANLVIAEAAVCDYSGRARLVRCDGGGGNGGMNYIGEMIGENDSDLVESTTLDDYCRHNGINRIDLMKIDVQGLEPDVMRGAIDLLSRRQIGHLLVELNWGEPGQSSPADDLVMMLENHGFQFSDICASPRWRKSGSWLRRHSDMMAAQVKASEP